MDKVWIVWGKEEYEADCMLRVFSSVESAKKLKADLELYLQSKPSQPDWGDEKESDRFLDEVDAWKGGFSGDKDIAEIAWTFDSFSIGEAEVKG